MQTIIHAWQTPGSFEALATLPLQEIPHDWYGNDVEPPLQYAMAADEDNLWFLASRQSGATIHPDAEPGNFQPELWKYDVAEFFIGSTETPAYWEFNLCLNGAWWACGFQNARQEDTSLPAPEGIETQGRLTDHEWQCMARIPLRALQGIDLRLCKIAVTSILNTPDQIFLTTADNLEGEPDFHRPADWAMPILVPTA